MDNEDNSGDLSEKKGVGKVGTALIVTAIILVCIGGGIMIYRRVKMEKAQKEVTAEYEQM
eukprot:CAMPEP_0197053692 /NCGR_PEP_ID=MMETSP1384-20130603/27897_1 /TAXON_ID=29189 /ORGANISM="Ammonia sp." /LENGTH=59 /DNA_ID=CAMNT_0042486629 /DNA_START=36 /DNA_END=215 /DNA_ORIENTATION=+